MTETNESTKDDKPNKHKEYLESTGIKYFMVTFVLVLGGINGTISISEWLRETADRNEAAIDAASKTRDSQKQSSEDSHHALKKAKCWMDESKGYDEDTGNCSGPAWLAGDLEQNIKIESNSYVGGTNANKIDYICEVLLLEGIVHTCRVEAP